ncbi:efflux RND transporter periplasmic adaptor subunit [Stygiobacter electus]|uniref:Efflux RND transporter periplasmic adaptor subunit n=1 Tax=Stygiobacter electus TaxID=3032292 RepID=A0AAE3P115_9BACT|nr:efflux RND transporter periplasmic adaptor subunit [Stygiobacter electus]MDF1612290.1 efflux RND transporter periplasmic adaptor subunit [Stygiobacter electus]
MKKNIITAIIFLIIGLGIGWFIFNSKTTIDTKSERKILYYRNPMDPTQTSPTPKKAPDGMDYVPVYSDKETKSGEKKIAYYKDPMHPWYTSNKPGIAPDCGMELVPVYEGESDVRGIKIDPVVVQNIGVRVETAKKQKLQKIIRTTAKIDYDERKVTTVTTKIMGWVEKLYVDYTGQYVKKGQPLFEIYSPELVSTQEEYLQAIRYLKKVSQGSKEVLDGAQELVNSAKRRLFYWDISGKDINEIEKNNSPKKTLTIYSPVNGIVVEKMVYQGQQVMAGMDLYKIADLSVVWAMADIYQMDLPWIKLGQNVDLELSYLPGKEFQGKVTYIYPFLNEETKTVKIRTEVRNTSNYEFKPGMFATVKFVSPVSINAIVVPSQAIIRSGERNIAVISLGGGYFEPREVKLGVESEGLVQVLEGIHEGENIVVSSQFLIDSESNLKAAIQQMSGHAGMDMKKPMNESKKSKAEEMDHSKMNHEEMDHSKMNHEEMDHSKMNHEQTKSKKEKSETSSIIRKGVIDLKSIDKNKDGKVFQDQMDWNVISDKPGKCPICGMTLKESTLEEAKANLIKHGFKIK